MTKHQLNKLPIIDTDGRPHGLITSASLLRAYFNYGFSKEVHELQVSEAMELAETFSDIEYSKVFSHLGNHSAAIVTEKNLAIGILTSYDTAGYYKQQAESFMTLGYIERELKNHILITFNSTSEIISKDLQDVIDNTNDKFKQSVSLGIKGLFGRLCNENILDKNAKENFFTQVEKAFPNTGKEFHRLTLNDYSEIAKANWSTIVAFTNFPADVWVSMMKDVVQMRNTLTHFRRELTTIEHDKLLYIGEWFRRRKAVVHATETNDSTAHAFSNQLFEDKNSPDSDTLVDFLSASVQVPTFTISFSGIEQMLSGLLPQQARESEAWWLDIFASSKAWSTAGWRVGKVELEERQITFFNWKIRVNIHDLAESKYWYREFKCTLEELMNAVQEVGDIPANVQKYLHPQNEGE